MPKICIGKVRQECPHQKRVIVGLYRVNRTQIRPDYIAPLRMVCKLQHMFTGMANFLDRKFTATSLLLAGAVWTAASLMSSCVSPPEYPLEPFLEFVSLSTNNITEGSTDTVFLRFSFTDGDGDVGNGDTQAPEADTTRNVFLEDSRIVGFPINYHIDEVQQSGNVNAISGFVDLRFNPGFFACLGLGPVDTLSLSVYLIDRAGNRSNTIRTTPITLTCQ